MLRKTCFLTQVAPRWAATAAAGLLLTASLAFATGRTLPPPNQLPSDPRFPAFLSALTEAVQRRDARALGALMAPDISSSLAEVRGVQRTLNHWQARDRNGRIWATLERILRIGGAATADRAFEAPYLISRFPQDLDEDHDYAVTDSDRAVLRAQPSANAQVVVGVPFAIVRILEWAGDHPWANGAWAKVDWGGRVGWIMGAELVRRDDPQFRAELKPGGWRIVWLVEGGE